MVIGKGINDDSLVINSLQFSDDVTRCLVTEQVNKHKYLGVMDRDGSD